MSNLLYRMKKSTEYSVGFIFFVSLEVSKNCKEISTFFLCTFTVNGWQMLRMKRCSDVRKFVLLNFATHAPIYYPGFCTHTYTQWERQANTLLVKYIDSIWNVYKFLTYLKWLGFIWVCVLRCTDTFNWIE